MAWLTIEKKGQEFTFMDGTPFALGERVHLGRGYVELRPNNGRGISVVRFRNDGETHYSAPMNRDGKYRVGDDHCFRLVEAREERDPVICALRLVGISPNLMRQLDGDENFSVNLFACDLEKMEHGTSTVSVITDGTVREMEANGPRKTVLVQPGTYAIEVVTRKHRSGSMRSNPERVAVWPGCVGRELALALSEAQVGKIARQPGYLEALSDEDAARDWIKRHYSIEPHPADGDILLVDGRPFSLERNDAEPAAIERLKSAHGWKVLREWFGPAHQEYLEAKRDAAAAANYLKRRYAVSGLRRGEDRFVRLLRLGQAGADGVVMSVGNPPPYETPYHALFARHWDLSERLFLNAQERNDLVAFYPLCQDYELRYELWYAKCHWSRHLRFDDWRPIANRAEAVEVSLDDEGFRAALCDLTAQDAATSPSEFESFYSCLRVADEAYVAGRSALLLLKPDEAKSYVFLVKLADGGKKVVGVNVARASHGLAFSPLITSGRYALTGARSIDVVAA